MIQPKKNLTAIVSATFREDPNNQLKANNDYPKYFVEIMFNSIPNRLNQFIAENLKLKRTLDFTEAELRTLEEVNNSQAGSLGAVETKQEVVSTVKKGVQIMEDPSRASNLRATGVEDQQDETIEQVLLKDQSIITDNL